MEREVIFSYLSNISARFAHTNLGRCAVLTINKLVKFINQILTRTLKGATKEIIALL